MNNLPSGTATFLFTDIEGSTKLAGDFLTPGRGCGNAVAILNLAIESHNSYVFQITGVLPRFNPGKEFKRTLNAIELTKIT
jgi:hypothetical protein